MAGVATVSSLVEYLDAVNDPKNRLELVGVPVGPWYLGQPDLGGNLVPALYKKPPGIEPDLEREMLRDYRQLSAEFSPAKGLSDADMLISAHMNGLPTRILEWSSNPLVALFLAVESLSDKENARVWVLNPWEMNYLTSDLEMVPNTEGGNFKKYVVNLDEPDASTKPEAIGPLAFRPTRTTRNYNVQSVCWTVHGNSPLPLNEWKSFRRSADAFVTKIHVDVSSKRAILRQLYDAGVTRVALFPGAASLTRTITHRYSKDFMG